MKLAFKLGLKMRGIVNDVVKEKIESVLANKTISPLDQLFWNSSKWWIRTAIIYTQSSTRFLKKKKKKKKKNS